jgi:hypothetical protein
LAVNRSSAGHPCPGTPVPGAAIEDRRYGDTVDSAPGGDAIAAVIYPAPHGTDGVLITPASGPFVAFGRGGDCAIRFGYAPHPDTRLPRRAGAFLIAGTRVAVENTSTTTPASLQVRAPGQPPVEVSPGEVYAPSALEYDVIVRGERDWTQTVRVRPFTSLPPSHGDPTTQDWDLNLSDQEHRVLAAYLTPLQAGRLEPATHTEVAAALHYSTNKVRSDLYSIWAKMIAGGVPVPDYHDKRMAVTTAAVKNGIILRQPEHDE